MQLYHYSDQNESGRHVPCHGTCQAGFKSPQVDFHTIWTWMETSGGLEGRKNTLRDLNHYDMFWKMADSNVRYSWFMVNGLKHATPPACSFFLMSFIFGPRSRQSCPPETDRDDLGANPDVTYWVRWPTDHTPKESEEPLSMVGLSEGHIWITSVCGLVVSGPWEQWRKTFTVTDTSVLSVPFSVDSHQPTVRIFGHHTCSLSRLCLTEVPTR